MLRLDNLRRKDTEYIEELVASSKRYLNGEMSDIEIINVIDDICDISWTYWKCDDQNLSRFKGIWSQIRDIKDAIKEGQETQEDLEEYIKSCVSRMKESCREIIEEYSPILEELKKKYPKDYKQSDIFYIEELIDVTNRYLNVKVDNYTIISEIDWLYSELKEYGDQKLLVFSDMWSEIVEIKSRIEKDNKSKEDLQQYLDSKSDIINKMCKIIIEEYTQILEELRKKFI